MRFGRLSILALLALALTACGSSGGSAVKTGGGGRVLFVAYSQSGGSIVSVDPSGGNRKTVVKLPAKTSAVSLNGPRLVYAVGPRVYTTNRQGGDRKLVSSGFNPNQTIFYGFSLDREGGKIAYANGPQALTHVYVGAVGGAAPRAITHGPLPDTDPQLSPDGSRIAFLRYTRRLRPQETAALLPNADVWIARSDGSGAHRVLSGVIGSYLQWSPNGRELAVTCVCSYFGITLLRADGGARRSYASDYQTTLPNSWSPDGKRIGFLDPDATTTGAANAGAIGVFRPAGSGAVASFSADLGVASAGPAWSPNGKKLAYVGCDSITQDCSLDVVDPSGASDDQIADAGSMPDAQHAGFNLTPVVAWHTS